jgi:dTDP-glucose pyrophosphorylase/predicted transcriptional regulator
VLDLIKDGKILYADELSAKDIIEAVKVFGYGYLALVNEQKKLVGIVTDADIRNCFLDGDISTEKLINRRPKLVTPDQSIASILTKMRKQKLRHIPLVGPKGKYIGFYSIDQQNFNLKKNKIILMAGGLGSRLGDLTKYIPKPMIKVAGKPVLEQIILKFISFGFVDFYISVNFQKEIVMDYFGDGSSFGINIKYLIEDQRLGTAGSLSLIDEDINLPIIVSNGDILTDLDFDEFLSDHIQSNASATMCIKKHEIVSPYGVVEFDKNNKISKFKEKPVYQSHINAGIYVINPDVLKFIPKRSFYDMPSLFIDISKHQLVSRVYEINNYWLDVGVPNDLEKASLDADKWMLKSDK